MWPIAAPALEAIRTSHSVTCRATAYLPGGAVYPDLPISGGTVTCDAKSAVRYTASVSVADPGLWPVQAIDALSPVGAELAIEYGIDVPGGDIAWVPLIRGPIQAVSGKVPAVDALSVTVADRSKTVADARLSRPIQTNTALTCVEVITDLITDRVSVEVLDLTGSTQPCPKLEIDKDPWQDGVEKIADAIGAEVFCDRLGRFVIRYVPDLEDPPVWQADAGTTGVLISLDRELTRERVYNAVVATGERTDGVPPTFAMVVDDDPASATFYGGPFGQRPRFMSNAALVTDTQAETAARAMLARVKGYVASVKITQITNPALEPGDVIELITLDGVKQTHIIDAVPIPLGPGDSQALTTRTADEIPGET